MTRAGVLLIGVVLVTPSRADEVVTYRDRSGRGGHLLQSVRGRVDTEALSGVRVGGRTIAAAEVVDVQYEVPGTIKLDLPRAVVAEATPGRAEEAVKEFRALLAAPAVADHLPLKRSFEFRIARLLGAGDDPAAAAAALEGFIRAHPGCWQRVAATRWLARRYLDRSPPDFAAARKAYDDLAAVAPADLKADCAFAVIDLLLEEKNFAEARRRLAAAGASDPRAAGYAVVCDAPADAAARLQKLIGNSGDAAKPALYNLLGDVQRADPAARGEALFAYLYVDQVYNFDAYELMKARDRLAAEFARRGQEERAKRYRDKARGR
jgi:hypothetical protein